MNRVQDKVVIVTGGGSGIGQATCYLLGREGATVALVDIDEKAGMETVSTLRSQGCKADFWCLDATHEESVKSVINSIAEKLGRIDVLVNNIGIIGNNKPTDEITEIEWDRVMNVNVKSVLFCTKHTIPHLKKAGGGSIVNVSSVHGLLGTPDYPANHASKGAVRLMTKTDAMLYVKDKIRVNSVHPGYIWTSLLENVARTTNIDFTTFRAHHDSLQPIGHMGSPDDVAYGILYLASDESKFVTASELVIDGGLTGGRLL